MVSDDMIEDMTAIISSIDSETAKALVTIVKSFKFEYVKQSFRNVKTELDSVYTNGGLNIIEYFHKFFGDMIKKDYQDKITGEKMYTDMMHTKIDEGDKIQKNKTENDSQVAKRKKRLAKS